MNGISISNFAEISQLLCELEKKHPGAIILTQDFVELEVEDKDGERLGVIEFDDERIKWRPTP